VVRKNDTLDFTFNETSRSKIVNCRININIFKHTFGAVRIPVLCCNMKVYKKIRETNWCPNVHCTVRRSGRICSGSDCSFCCGFESDSKTNYRPRKNKRDFPKKLTYCILPTMNVLIDYPQRRVATFSHGEILMENPQCFHTVIIF
jgi:hypothetical protein